MKSWQIILLVFTSFAFMACGDNVTTYNLPDEYGPPIGDATLTIHSKRVDSSASIVNRYEIYRWELPIGAINISSAGIYIEHNDVKLWKSSGAPSEKLVPSYFRFGLCKGQAAGLRIDYKLEDAWLTLVADGIVDCDLKVPQTFYYEVVVSLDSIY